MSTTFLSEQSTAAVTCLDYRETFGLDEPVIKFRPAAYLCGGNLLTRVFAAFLLCICSPLIAVLVVLVRLTSRGPGVYRQVRVGKHGKIFVMYKLRSMVHDAEADTGPAWTQGSSDPRITVVGKFLRKSHLDELPQLLNVVCGDMLLFGPRPERPELVSVLAEHVPHYLDRLAVEPGITGLAQINLPPDTDIESVRQKLILDLEYIRTANLGLDARMFVWTGLRLIAIPSALATRIMCVGRKVRPVAASQEGPVTIEDICRNTESVGHRTEHVARNARFAS